MFPIADISSIATFSFSTFSASDHRGFFSVANDSLLPLSICFLIFLLRLSFFEFIAIYHRQHTIFAFPVETKKDVSFFFCLGIAFTFSTLVGAVCGNSVGGSDDDDD